MSLSVEKLRCRYGKMVVVEDATFVAEKGEVVTLFGPNGSGKTTLLKAIMGLVKAEGKIVFNGEEISGLSPLERFKRGIVYVPERAVFRRLTVEDNLKLVNPNFDLSLFPLLKGFLKVKAGNLSGGQARLLALAMAYNSGARLLLLDEPSSGLSPKAKSDIALTIKELQKQGVTILVAEQDAEFTRAISNKVYIMRLGTIEDVVSRDDEEKLAKLLKAAL